MELQLASGLVDSCLALFSQQDRSLPTLLFLGVCKLSPELALTSYLVHHYML